MGWSGVVGGVMWRNVVGWGEVEWCGVEWCGGWSDVVWSGGVE